MGDEAQYIQVGGLSFDPATPMEVAKLIAGYVDEPVRIRLDYGNPETGESNSSEIDVEGYVRRSDGDVQFPVLLPTSRSSAGNPISCNIVVAIWGTDGSRVYKHPTYTPKYDWKNARIARSEAAYLSKSPWQVLVRSWKFRDRMDAKEDNPMNFGTEGQAIRWLTKKRKFEIV